ncbi:MAG: hypothetical protein WBW33_38080, partial [Bryobacteraceae bacterium]
MRFVTSTPAAAFSAMSLPMLYLAGQPKAPVAPSFVDVTAQTGIQFVHQASLTTRKYLIESMSGGVALFDYDGDGLLDIFFVNGAALA